MSNFKQKPGVPSDSDVRRFGESLVYAEGGTNRTYEEVAVSGGGSDPALSGNLQTQIDDLNSEIDQLEQDITTLSGDLESAIISGGGVLSVNGNPGPHILLYGNEITANFTPTNYDAVDGSITGNIEGIDNKLGQVQTTLTGSTPNRIAIFDENGSLTTSGDFYINADHALTFNKDEIFFNPSTPGGRNLHQRNYYLRPAENITNEFTNFYQWAFDLNPDGNDFSFGTLASGGGVGLLSSRISNKGNGFCNAINGSTLFLELNSPSGVTNWAAGTTTDLVVRSGHLASLARAQFAGINLDGFSTVSSVLVDESALTIWSGATLEYGTGQRFQLAMTAGSRIATNMSLAAVGIIDHGSVSKNDSQASGVDGLNINMSTNHTGHYINGINEFINTLGTISGNIVGLNMNFANGLDCPNIQGVKVDMGNYDYSQFRRNGMSINNGSINFFNQVSTQSGIFFDQSNLLINLFHIQSGHPIGDTEFISHNCSTLFFAEDDMTTGPFGLGAVGMLAGGQVAVLSGKQVDRIQLYMSGLSINEMSNGGTIEDVHVFSSFGLVDLMGGGGTVNLTNLRTFYMKEGSQGTNKWGLYIADPDAENFLSKSLIVGGATDKVTNSGVGIEIGSKTALKLTGMTVSERDALTPVFGMIVAIDDGATKELQFYDGSGWVTL